MFICHVKPGPQLGHKEVEASRTKQRNPCGWCSLEGFVECGENELTSNYWLYTFFSIRGSCPWKPGIIFPGPLRIHRNDMCYPWAGPFRLKARLLSFFCYTAKLRTPQSPKGPKSHKHKESGSLNRSLWEDSCSLTRISVWGCVLSEQRTCIVLSHLKLYRNRDSLVQTQEEQQRNPVNVTVVKRQKRQTNYSCLHPGGVTVTSSSSRIALKHVSTY